MVAKVVVRKITIPIHPKHVDSANVRCILQITQQQRTGGRTHHRPIVCAMHSTRDAMWKKAQCLHDGAFVVATTFVHGDNNVGILCWDPRRIHGYVPLPCRIG